MPEDENPPIQPDLTQGIDPAQIQQAITQAGQALGGAMAPTSPEVALEAPVAESAGQPLPEEAEALTEAPTGDDPLVSNKDTDGVLLDSAKGIGQGAINAVNDIANLPNLVSLGAIPSVGDWNVFGKERDTIVGNLSQDLTEFASVFIGAGKVFTAVKAFRKLPGFLQGMIKGTAADVTVFGKEDETLTDTLSQVPWLKDYLPNFLQSEEDDSVIAAKGKHAVEGLVLGGVFESVGKAVKSGIGLFRNKNIAKAAKKAGLSEPEFVSRTLRAKDPIKGLDDTVEFSSENANDVHKAAKDLNHKHVDEQGNWVEMRPLTEVGSNKSYGKVTEADKESVEELKKLINSGDIDLNRTLEAGDLNLKKMGFDQDGQKLARAIEILHDTSPEILSKDAASKLGENLPKLVEDTAEALGTDPDLLLINVQKIGDDSEGFIKSMHKLVATINVGQERVRQAYKAVIAPNSSKDELAEFIAARDFLSNITLPFKRGRRASSEGLRAFKQIPNLDELAKNVKAMDTYIASDGGAEASKALASRLSLIDYAPAAMKFLNQDSSFMKKLGDAGKGMWYGAILSGPSTHVRNMTSTFVNTVIRPLETGMGAALTGNVVAVKREMRRFYQLFAHAGQSIKFAGKAFRDKVQAFDPSTRAIIDEQINMNVPLGRRSGLDTENGGIFEKGFGHAFNFIGKASDLPGRFLLAEDEIFKQSSGYASLNSQFWEEGVKKGLKDAELAEYINLNTNRAVNSEGRLVTDFDIADKIDARARSKGLVGEERAAYAKKMYDRLKISDNIKEVSERALDEARLSTFTTPLKEDSFLNILNKLKNSHPIAALAVPFVRTPYNVLAWGAKRFPGIGLMSSNVRKRLAGKMGKFEQQAAIGEQAFGALSTFSMGSLAWQNKVTGQGPTTGAERDVWLKNNQPYSINLGPDENGKTEWMPFAYHDPMFLALGIMADIQDIAQENDEDSMNLFTNVLGSTQEVISRLIMNKTYASGIAQLLGAIDGGDYQKLRSWKSLGASAIPSILGQTTTLFEDNADGEIIREVTGVLDAIKKRIPGLKQTLPPKYGPLGEVITRNKIGDLDGFNPWYITSTPNDPVYKEFENIAFAPSRLAARNSGINYREINHPETGETAFHAYSRIVGEVKIDGISLRRAVTNTINSKGYLKLVKEKILKDEITSRIMSPREKVLRKIINKYRRAARVETQKQIPVLKKAIEDFKAAKKIHGKQEIKEDGLDNRAQGLVDNINSLNQ